jgi:hypothetical protein
MSFELPDTLNFDGSDYQTTSFPLNHFYRQSGIASPFQPIRPGYSRGYVARWTVESDRLFLANVRGSLKSNDGVYEKQLDIVFPDNEGWVFAAWYTGLLRCFQGERCYLGTLSNIGFEQEVLFDVVAGTIKSVEFVDNTNVPDVSDDEIRKGLPEFLWPARLKTSIY